LNLRVQFERLGLHKLGQRLGFGDLFEAELAGAFESGSAFRQIVAVTFPKPSA